MFTRDLLLPLSEESIVGTGGVGIGPAEASRGTCGYAGITLAVIYHAPVAKRAQKGTLLAGVEDRTEKFGPLKVALGAIIAHCANREVGLPSPTQYPPLTATPPGIRCGGEQG